MTAYLGSVPYCYSNALCMVTGDWWPPGAVETLTGSAFGYQLVDGVPYFDPVGWDPDAGLDQALELLGWRSERRTFAGPTEAYEELGRLSARSPVFVGPLEMGLLRYQPGSDRPLGADHFVVVLEAGAEGVTIHDPQGFPYAWLPGDAFLQAWGSPLPYGTGRFPLRTGIGPVRERPLDEAVAGLLGPAARWARDPGNVRGLRELAARAREGLDEGTAAVLGDFSLRLAARRRLDAAHVLAGHGRIPSLLDRQARLLGPGPARVCEG